MDDSATQHTVSHLRTYMTWHAGAAVAVLLLWFALWLTILVPSFGLLISLIAGIPMLYPLTAALLLIKARQKIARRQLDAPRWIRWSMAFALPGSLAVGVGSTLLATMGILNGDIAGTLFFVPFVLIGLSSVFVLLRMIRTDLDEILWAEAGEPIDEALNFREDDDEDEVEFGTTDGEERQVREEDEATRDSAVNR